MRQAFTLIELMIVIAIIAIIAAIAIPNLLESRITANESAAAASLKSGIFAGQAQFQSGAYSDQDGDGRGEYANCTAWMAGATSASSPNVAAAKKVAAVPGQNTSATALALIAPTYNVLDNTAVGGYQFEINTDLTAFASGGATPSGDMSTAESFWAGYASPNNPGSDGRRSFAINTAGVVYSTKQTIAVVDCTNTKVKFGGANPIFATNPISTNPSVVTTNATPYQK